eukprot:g2854.t1
MDFVANDVDEQPAAAYDGAERLSIIIVEGNISAGKSTLCKELSAALEYAVFLEPTVANPYLEKYYAEPKVYALPMQIWLLKQRFVTYCHAIQYLISGKAKEQGMKGVILDRSIFSDCVFAEKNFVDENFSAEGYAFYNELRSKLLGMLPPPQLALYLDASAKVCYDRIHNLRGRACEGGIPLEYLEGLDKCYKSFLERLSTESNVPICSVPWDTFGSTANIVDMVTSNLKPFSMKAEDFRRVHKFVSDKEIIRQTMAVEMHPEALGPDHRQEPVADPAIVTSEETIYTPVPKKRRSTSATTTGNCSPSDVAREPNVTPSPRRDGERLVFDDVL